MNTIKAAKLQDNAIIPTRKHPDDAGIDFYAVEETEIDPGSFGIVRTGITVEIPKGYAGLLKPKSRNNHLLGAGVVDAGYQGEIQIKIANVSGEILHIEYGQAIAQMLIIPIETPVVEEVPISEIHTKISERGATGGILGNS
jgi:dUTP pyrophosphatase